VSVGSVVVVGSLVASVTAFVVVLSVASLLTVVGPWLVLVVGFAVVLSTLVVESPPSPPSLPRPAASKEQAPRVSGRSAIRRDNVSEAMVCDPGRRERRRGQLAW